MDIFTGIMTGETKTEVINDIKSTGLSSLSQLKPSDLLKTEFKNGLKTEKGKYFQ